MAMSEAGIHDQLLERQVGVAARETRPSAGNVSTRIA